MIRVSFKCHQTRQDTPPRSGLREEPMRNTTNYHIEAQSLQEEVTHRRSIRATILVRNNLLPRNESATHFNTRFRELRLVIDGGPLQPRRLMGNVAPITGIICSELGVEDRRLPEQP